MRTEAEIKRVKAWIENNPERRREIQKRYRDRHRDAIRIRRSARNKAKSAAERELMAGRPAPDKCEVCGGEEGPRKRAMHFDHCHATGKFRGWLCARCNMTLGQVADDIELLKKLIAYLKNAMGEQDAY